MSRQNVEIVRAAYFAYVDGGVDALFPYFDSGVEWDMTKTGVADQVYWGPDGVREFFERLAKAWNEYTFRYQTYLDAGDEVLAIGSFRGQARGTANKLDVPLVHIWKLRDGKAVRLRAYLDYSEALEAAVGLRYRGKTKSVEVVRRALDAFARRDMPSFLYAFDPDAQVTEDTSIPDAASYRGHEGVKDWWRGLEHNWEDLQMRPERFIHDGDDVAVLLKVQGRGRTSGVPVDGEFGGVLRFRDGRIVKWQIYAGWGEVLNAWGLREEELKPPT